MKTLRPLIACGLLVATPALAGPACPLAAAPDTLSRGKIVDAAVDRAWAKHGAVPGMSIAVVQGSRLIYARGFGVADLQSRAAVDPGRTLFRIGSLTKLFTYTAALRLAATGRLALDADVDRYIGDAALRPAPWPPVRLRDLFTHRAGFEDAALGFTFMNAASTVPSLHDYVLHDRPARIWPAGTVTAYSNYGVALLGYIVERQAGIPYPRVIADQILDPLGMRSTTLAEPVADGEPAPLGRMSAPLAARTATGYARWFGQLKPFPHEHIFPAAAPAGAAFSTATDMACFMQAALGGGPAPFSPGIRSAFATRPYRDRPAMPDYGHGFIDGRFGSLPTLSHGGAMGGFRAGMTLLPTLDTGIFVAVNASTGGDLVDAVQAGIVTALAPQASAAPPARASQGDFARRWSLLTGTYLNQRRSRDRLEAFLLLDGGSDVSVSIDPAGFLLIASGDNPPERYTEIGPRLFRAGQKTAFFTGAGQATELYIDVKSYARIRWIDRVEPMLWLRWIAALCGAGVIISLIGLRPRRWFDAVAALGGVGSIALGWGVGHVLDDADARGEFLAYDWPTNAITALSSAAVLVALTLACVLPMVLTPAYRQRLGQGRVIMMVLWALTSALLLADLAHWNLFAPAN